MNKVLLVVIVVILSLIILFPLLKGNKLALTLKAEQEADLQEIIKGTDSYQRMVLLQGDALEYQRQQDELGARTVPFDPTGMSYASPSFDSITDTAGFVKHGAMSNKLRNAALKVYDPASDSWKLSMPLTEAGFLPSLGDQSLDQYKTLQ